MPARRLVLLSVLPVWLLCQRSLDAQAGAPERYERAGAQIKYDTGQDVAPVFEGWEHAADGSYEMVFGYMNRNYVEQVDIPVGPKNMFEPGLPDRGQPTHFYRRRQQFVFKVKVPKDWGDKELVWTLVTAGKANRVSGTLANVWELSSLVYQENRKGPGDYRYPTEPEAAPSIETVGPSQLSAVAGEPLSISVDIADDGHPEPVAPRRGANSGRETSASVGGQAENPIAQAVVRLDPGVRLEVTWIVYRAGPGEVKFDPPRTPVVALDPVKNPVTPLKGRATTKVTFSKAGTYQLRAYADDGILSTPQDLTVTVKEK